jgi:hypothetical protein
MHFNVQSAFRHAWLALRECNSAPMITSAEPAELTGSGSPDGKFEVPHGTAWLAAFRLAKSDLVGFLAFDAEGWLHLPPRVARRGAQVVITGPPLNLDSSSYGNFRLLSALELRQP